MNHLSYEVSFRRCNCGTVNSASKMNFNMRLVSFRILQSRTKVPGYGYIFDWNQISKKCFNGLLRIALGATCEMRKRHGSCRIISSSKSRLKVVPNRNFRSDESVSFTAISQLSSNPAVHDHTSTPKLRFYCGSLILILKLDSF